MLAASIGTASRGRGADFQRLARQMGVDAVLVGSITEYSPYYPPRMGLAVDWYAANPSFHPIPAGYGLPWGRAEEEFIPSTLVQEAEFALAREQLKTQTPECAADLRADDSRKTAQRLPSAEVSCATSAEASPAGRHQQLALPAHGVRQHRCRRLARSARIHSAAASASEPPAAAAARADHDAHADLSRPGRKVYRAAGDVTTICATTPASAAGPAICSDRTTSSDSAATCT